MSNMISFCTKIESLPDLSKWDTRKVKNMSHMITGNSELKKLPDISKWNTNKVEDMEHMFAYCRKIELFPDISKWELSSILNMSYMFSHCTNLNTYPNIFKWKIKNRANLRGIFYSCGHVTFPEKIDISDWDINEQCVVSYMFYDNYNFYWDFPDEQKIKMSDKFKIGFKFLDIWNNRDKYNYKDSNPSSNI